MLYANIELIYIFTANHDMSVIKLNIGVSVFVQDVISTTSRRWTNQFPVINYKLVSSRSLKTFENWIFFSPKIKKLF